MKKYFYINGQVLDIKKPAVQINDIGILRGYGVFDFFRTYHRGKIFHWEDHFARFVDSAKRLDLRVPLSREGILVLIKKLLKKNNCSDASIRLILTGGPTDDGLSYKKPTLAITIEDLYGFPKSFYQKGVKVISCEYERPLPQAKNNNYLLAIKMAPLKKKKGAVEVLYVSRGKILEATMANFFIMKGATLITPKDDVLRGITRKVVLKLARRRFKVEEREVKISELDSATEAFLTSTNKLIMPVVMVDNKKIGDGVVGENTKLLMEEFKKYIEKY